jgi:hypothetical protein
MAGSPAEAAQAQKTSGKTARKRWFMLTLD